MQTPQILQQLGVSTQNPLMAMLPKIKQAKALMGAIQNPQMAMNQILQQNPQVNAVISQYGSVENAINALCSQQGINVQEFMEVLK